MRVSGIGFASGFASGFTPARICHISLLRVHTTVSLFSGVMMGVLAIEVSGIFDSFHCILFFGFMVLGIDTPKNVQASSNVPILYSDFHFSHGLNSFFFPRKSY